MARRKILVCGSRDWSDSLQIQHRLTGEESALVIHGGAKGADELAGDACEVLHMHCAVIKPLWDAFGKSAGYLRDRAMLDLQPDLVIAFTTGSPGTQLTINEARKRGIPVEVHGAEQPIPDHQGEAGQLSATCGSCKAPIIWAWAEKGKRMPLNAAPDPDGLLEIVGTETDDNGRSAPLIRHCTRDELTLPGFGRPERYTSHFASCPNAAKHRR